VIKRVVLFLITNLAVVFVLSIALRLLEVDRMLAESGGGLDLRALLVFSAVIGFGGALVSLAMSKWSAKMMTGAKVIDHPHS
jgi:heat shock protein HtpX